MQALPPNGRNNIEVFLSKHWSLIAQQKMCYRVGGRVDAIEERMRKIMVSILRWVIYRLLWILRRTVIPYNEDFKFYPKNTKSKRMNWLSKEIKMYIFKFFQRKNSRWFWLYFVVTITIIQKKTIALQQENTPVTWSCISSGEKLALVFWIIQQENTLVTSSCIDWVRKWREFSGLITERCKYNPGWLSTTNGKLSWDSNTTL